MSKRIFGINEFIILTVLLGMLVLFAVRLLNPEVLNQSFFGTRIGSFLLGCFFCYFTLHEYKTAKSKDEWRPNRIAGVIRVPLYCAAAIFLFYIAATRGINA